MVNILKYLAYQELVTWSSSHSPVF